MWSHHSPLLPNARHPVKAAEGPREEPDRMEQEGHGGAWTEFPDDEPQTPLSARPTEPH